MRKRLVVSYITVAALILLVLEVPLGIVYARHERDVASAGLQRDAAAVATLAEEGVERHDNATLASLAARYRTVGGADVEILGGNGAVLVAAGSDEGELATGAVHSRVESILNGGSEGVEHLGDGDELFALAPIGSTVPPAGAVIVTEPDTQVNRRVHAAWVALGLLAAAVVAAVAGLGLVVARSVIGPLTDLERAALRLGRGDLTARAAATGPPEVQALGLAFNDMAARLEELVAAQHAFIADASHQLRSPLTALRLRLENVAAAPAGADTTEIDAVLGEIDRLSRVVDGLLLLARSEGRRPAREVVDLGEIAAERRDAWAALAEEAGIRLDFEDPGRLVAAWFVPGHLEQILDNLLANAVEATPSGKGVRLVVETAGGRSEVHVIDEGRGMAEEERVHAFDRLWRGAGSRPGSGSGLGLAIVRQLARASGAEVELRVADGGGVDAVVTAAPARPRDQPAQRASVR